MVYFNSCNHTAKEHLVHLPGVSLKDETGLSRMLLRAYCVFCSRI